MTFTSRLGRFALAASVVGASIAACSASKAPGLDGDDGSGNDDASTSGGDDGGGGGSTSSSGGPFGSGSKDTGTSGPSSVDAACASSSQQGEQQALDAYLMLDYSGSMIGAKWTGVTKAVNSFVAQPTTGISVGLQYFGLADLDSGLSLGGLIPVVDSCDPSVYATPAIEIAPLPGVGNAITSSLAAHVTPDTSTPTPAALQGAINHASAWAKSHSSDVTIVILATDGEPSECGAAGSTASLLSQVEAIAAAGAAATPKVLTFVIGVGSDLTSLNGIAMAGGTGSAFIVDTTMDVSAQFLAALDKIRGSALGCQYKIPAPKGGASVNFGEVNVQFTATGGKPAVVPQVPDKAHCPSSGNAWYYDNPTSPSQILLCTTTCGTVSAGGELDVLTGCQTVIVPTK